VENGGERGGRRSAAEVNEARGAGTVVEADSGSCLLLSLRAASLLARLPFCCFTPSRCRPAGEGNGTGNAPLRPPKRRLSFYKKKDVELLVVGPRPVHSGRRRGVAGVRSRDPLTYFGLTDIWDRTHMSVI
jgi:hypothetical protein